MVDTALIARAAQLIRSGRVVAFPTETVYGLGANALDPVAVSLIYEIKQRPRSSPLIVHVSSVNMARDLAAVWPEEAEILTHHLWPGPLTLVLPKNDKIPLELTAGLTSVGLRMPDHPIALALIDAAQVPIAAPSANRFMQLSPTTAEHVRAGLGASVEMILDGGPTAVGIESTVLSLVDRVPVLLRPGMVRRDQIEALIGRVALAENVDGAHASPGLHLKHYSPKTPLLLIAGAHELPREGHGVYLYLTVAAHSAQSWPMPHQADRYAAALYETLHRCDALGKDWIAVEQPGADSAWAGVLDRLERASVR